MNTLAIAYVQSAIGLLQYAINAMQEKINRCINCGKPLPGRVCEWCGWDNLENKEVE